MAQERIRRRAILSLAASFTITMLLSLLALRGGAGIAEWARLEGPVPAALTPWVVAVNFGVATVINLALFRRKGWKAWPVVAAHIAYSAFLAVRVDNASVRAFSNGDLVRYALYGVWFYAVARELRDAPERAVRGALARLAQERKVDA